MSAFGAAAAQDEESPEGGVTETTAVEVPTTAAPTTTAAEPDESPVTTAVEVPTTPAPTTMAAPASDAEQVDSSEDGSDVDWALVAVIALAVVIAVVVLAVLLAAVQRQARKASDFRRRLAELVGRVQWIHDEGSLEVLGAASTPNRMELVWSDTLRRINDVSSRASALAASTSDPSAGDELRELSASLGRLAGALDTHVSLHSQLAGDSSIAAALAGASETVMQRRLEVSRALEPLAARI